MMNLLICIDDTDNLESRGTGSIAAEMTELIERKGWGRCGIISRHQLVLHKDVRYTSHNSSMCFNTTAEDCYFEQLKTGLTEYLAAEMAAGSDPGICIADIDRITERSKVIEFGYRAKTEVMTKQHAYSLSRQAGIFLEETGGTGDGIIGALAGAGLRLHGYDGEVKGGIADYEQGGRFTVDALLTNSHIAEVCTTDMKPLGFNEEVVISWKAKPVLHAGRPVLIVRRNPENSCWLTLVKNEMRRFGEARAVKRACGHFKPDVPEEFVDGDSQSCYNCIYRRWTEKSFTCMLGKETVEII